MKAAISKHGKQKVNLFVDTQTLAWHDRLMASIQLPRKAKTYNASVRVWSAAKNAFTWACWSTGKQDPQEAQKVADAFQEAADAIAPDVQRRKDATYLKRVFDTMCHRAGIDTDAGDDPDFATFAKDWLRRRSERTKDSTQAAYEAAVADFTAFLSAGRHPMGSITAIQLQDYYDGMLAAGQSTGTARNKFAVIAGIFKRAHELGGITRNPAAAVEMQAIVQAERKPFTAEQEARIFNYLQASNKTDWFTACMLARWAAMRLGDAISLTWEDIEFADNHAIITYTPQKKTKRNGEGKKVVIPALGPLSAYLTELYSERGAIGFTFVCPSLASLTSKNAASSHFARFLEAAGIDRELIERDGGNDFHALSFHSWRSTCISWLANAGVDKETRMLIANHDSEKVHAGYTHRNAVMLGEKLKHLTATP